MSEHSKLRGPVSDPATEHRENNIKYRGDNDIQTQASSQQVTRSRIGFPDFKMENLDKREFPKNRGFLYNRDFFLKSKIPQTLENYLKFCITRLFLQFTFENFV